MVGERHFEVVGGPEGHGVAHQRAVDIIGDQGESLGLGQSAHRCFLIHFEAVRLLVHVPCRVAAAAECNLLFGKVVIHAVAVHAQGCGILEFLTPFGAEIGEIRIIVECDVKLGETGGTDGHAVDIRQVDGSHL